MTTEQLRLVHTSKPFSPFTIHTADGVPHPVPHPEFLAHAPGTRTCAVSDQSGLVTVIDLLLVTRITTEPVETSSKTE
jgi:hypothetical protein